jgi:hypothetical protein
MIMMELQQNGERVEAAEGHIKYRAGDKLV